MGIQANHRSVPSSFDPTKEDSISTSSTMTDEDEMEDDASSSLSSSSSSSKSGPIYELAEMMNNLPIKRGLSKHYEGKSQSFASLGSVMSLEDLAKKEHPYNKRMKLVRSYGGGFCSPKHTIAKKSSPRGAFLSAMVGMNDLLSVCNSPPVIPMRK